MKDKTAIEILKTGFPHFNWQEFHDRKLNKHTVMRSDCDNVNERLFNGRLRYKKL